MARTPAPVPVRERAGGSYDGEEVTDALSNSSEAANPNRSNWV